MAVAAVGIAVAVVGMDVTAVGISVGGTVGIAVG